MTMDNLHLDYWRCEIRQYLQKRYYPSFTLPCISAEKERPTALAPEVGEVVRIKDP
jgi:hypothetical protein